MHAFILYKQAALVVCVAAGIMCLTRRGAEGSLPTESMEITRGQLTVLPVLIEDNKIDKAKNLDKKAPLRVRTE